MQLRPNIAMLLFVPCVQRLSEKWNCLRSGVVSTAVKTHPNTSPPLPGRLTQW